MSAWLVVAAAGAASYLLRISMLVLAARVGLPAALERAAHHAVPTAFAALAATALAGTVAAGSSGTAMAPLGAVALGAAAVHRTGSRHAALLVGMPALWLLSALLPA